LGEGLVYCLILKENLNEFIFNGFTTQPLYQGEIDLAEFTLGQHKFLMHFINLLFQTRSAVIIYLNIVDLLAHRTQLLLHRLMS
jgi:hypothetical protein